MLCTADVPTSACSTYYVIAPLNGSAYLALGHEIVVSPHETVFGPDVTEGRSWRSSEFSETLVGYTKNMLDPSQEVRWGGPLTELNNGFIGVRVTAADGNRYGWIHLRHAQDELLQAPEILGWALETVPEKAIRAGAKPVVIPLGQVASSRAGYLQLKWESHAGKAYQVQIKETLA